MDNRVKNELKKGLESANQLRLLFSNSQLQNKQLVLPSLNHHSSIVLNTFETAISMLKNPQFNQNHNICYDNKRTGQSQPVKVIKCSAIPDDGYCWRKYGRKPIANTKHPREYYRCGHQGEGCPARKQVQIVSENPTKYGIIYYDHHTCQNISIHGYTSQFGHLFVDSNDNECPNMLCFGSKNIPTIAKQGLNMMKQEHMVVNEDMPNLLPHNENTPWSSSPPPPPLLDQWVEELVEEDVGLPQWCYSMDSPLFTNEDIEYLMTHVVDFDHEVDR